MRRLPVALALVLAVLTLPLVGALHHGHPAPSSRVPVGEARESPASEGWGMRSAAHWFYWQREYPRKTTPPGALLHAQRQARAVRTASLTEPSAAPTAYIRWTNRGPRPIITSPPNTITFSGRISSIAPHTTDPKTAYIAAAGGGIWKTADGGTTWSPRFDRGPTTAMGAVALDPANPSVVFAGTGDWTRTADAYYGLGLFRSADGGTTWKKVGGTLFDGCHTGDIAVLPRTGQPSIVLVGTEPGTPLGRPWGLEGPPCTPGLFRSVDGGLTFARVPTSNTALYSSRIQAMDLERVNGTLHVYAALFGRGIWKSSDAGATWTRLAGGLPTTDIGNARVAVAPSNHSIVYAALSTANGALRGIYVSKTAGSSWSRTTDTTSVCGASFGNYGGVCGNMMALAVNPQNPATFYAGGLWLARFSNYGAAHAELPGMHGDFRSVVFGPGGWQWIASDGGIWRSGDGGTTTVDLNKTLSITQLYPGTSGSPARTVVAGSQDNSSPIAASGVVYTQTNPSWKYGGCGNDGFRTAVDPLRPNDVFYFTTLGDSWICKTLDGGKTFELASSGIAPASVERRMFVTPFEMSSWSGQTLYAGTSRLYRTTNGAASWQPISPIFNNNSQDSGGAPITAIGPANQSVIYAAISNWGTTRPLVKVTKDGGASWATAITGLPDRIVTDFEVNRTYAGYAYATVSGFGTPHVFKTGDYGAHWASISGNLPNTPVNSIAVDRRTSPATLYVGTDVGVFWSVDGGVTWGNTSLGLPNAVVFEVRIDTFTNTLIAATHGRGLFTAPVPNVTIPAPKISSFTPASGPTGSTVTVNGSYLSNPIWVKVNGVPVSSFTPVSATQLRLVVPPTARTGRITVTTAGGTGTSATDFVVTRAITSLTPTSGKTGAQVTINGFGFHNPSTVKFNGRVSPTVNYVSSTQVTATVPDGATTGPVTVSDGTSTAASPSPSPFNVTFTLASFSPTSCSLSAGCGIVTLNGLFPPGDATVKFGSSTAVPAERWADNTVMKVYNVPGDATTGKITVTIGGQSVQSATDFTVTS